MLQRNSSTVTGATGSSLPNSGRVDVVAISPRRRGAMMGSRKKKAVQFSTTAASLIAAVLLLAPAALLFGVTSLLFLFHRPAETDREKFMSGVANLLRGRIDPIKPLDRDVKEIQPMDWDTKRAQPWVSDEERYKMLWKRSKPQTVEPIKVPYIDPLTLPAVGDEYPYPLEKVDESYDIATNFRVLGGWRFAEYSVGESPYSVSAETRQKSDAVARTRRFHVKKAMQYAWNGYVKYAFGMDELMPQSGKGSNAWGGQGMTLVDSLDTLWLMDMKDEFWQARDWVRDHLDHSKIGLVSLFETTIRDLGGLLAAYDWSGDRVFLEKATDLGERLLHGFDGSLTGLPVGKISLNEGSEAGAYRRASPAILAEFGSIQLEFRYLAKQTGRPELAQKTDRVFEIMHEISPANGLFPFLYYSNLRNPNALPAAGIKTLTFGAMADSFYEYMLKLWLQSGKTEPMYREMYDKAMDGMHNELLQKSTPSGLTYIADMNYRVLDTKMGHLVCFMGGLLALGAYTDPQGLESERAVRDLRTAKALTYTCYQMYARTNTGISAEFVHFSDGQDFQIRRGSSHYILRPEAIESMFILNQLTGDPVYREWGWEIFQAIEKLCKTEYGYGALSNVQDPKDKPRDSMESFFLAETLKYSFLLQDPDTEIDVLKTHVFNTEAHPLRIFPDLTGKTSL